MFILLGGILLLVGFMLTVMGIPLVHYLKRDRHWAESGQSLDAWYR